MHGYHQRGRMTDDNGVIVHDPATTVAIDFAKVPILSFLSARRVVLGSPASKPARGNLFSPWDRRVVLSDHGIHADYHSSHPTNCPSPTTQNAQPDAAAHRLRPSLAGRLPTIFLAASRCPW